MKPSGTSLRLRFALGAAGLACLIVALFALGTYAFMRTELFREIDLEIEAEREHLTEGLLARPPPPRLVTHQPWINYTLIDAQGRALHGSGALAAIARLDVSGLTRPHTVRTPTVNWRLAIFRVGPHRLVVGYDLRQTDYILGRMLLASSAGAVAAMALAAATAWWLSARVLEPVKRLTKAAERIDIGGLDQRVPLPESRDELHRLTKVINAMLARLEIGVAQARRFSADASHELRTPLTILRGEVDRLLHTEGFPLAHESRLLRIQETSGRLQRIIEHLLLLAELDAGAAPARRDSLDFSAVVQDACEDASLLAESAGIRIESNLRGACWVRGDSDSLRRLVTNLLDNAIRYNRPGGHVTCDLGLEHGRLALTIANTGTSPSPELRTRLFQRFSRGDPARGPGGNGLGLALSREIARAHGGDIELISPPEDSNLTTFRLLLPTQPAPAGRA